MGEPPEQPGTEGAAAAGEQPPANQAEDTPAGDTTSTGPAATDGAAARSTSGGTTRTVLNSEYEPRKIVVAQGVQFTNADFRAHAAAVAERYRQDMEELVVPDGLQPYFSDLQISGEEAEYVSDRQHVRFTIRVVRTKDALKRAMETEGIHVVYHGHARYGRGPCFGTFAPGDDWEQGSDPTTTGILRMGYPVIGVPLVDIQGDAEHKGGYHFWPVPASQVLERSVCHPTVRSRLGHLNRIPLPDALRNMVLPQGQPVEDAYYSYTDSDGTNLLLWAGWNETHSDPWDLGATDMVCKCFVHLGCSTYLHNWRIIRELKGWARTPVDRFAYFTTGPAGGPTSAYWLRALFSYPHRNDYQSWYPSLQWARSRANSLLAVWFTRLGARMGYQLI